MDNYIDIEQLIFCISQRYPHLVAGRDYILARMLEPDGQQQCEHARIHQWLTTSVPKPDIELLYADWSRIKDEYTRWLTAENIRAERNNRLLEADSLINIATDSGDTERASALKVYRQTLRDIPEQDGFPSNVTWPTLPNARPEL